MNNDFERIKEVDEGLRDLFVKRMEILRDIAHRNKELGLTATDSGQEAELLSQTSLAIEDEAIRSFYLCFMRDVLDVSSQWQHHLQKGLRVAYSGVEGAFAHIAAKSIFPEGTIIAHPTFDDAYVAVEKGQCDIAVLPIENSYAGEVGQVIDLMFSGTLHVNGVYDLPVDQSLLGLPGATIDEIRTVLSHPQALEQCGPYIRRHGFQAESLSNTAFAAKKVAEDRDLSVAAIANEQTADIYGLEVLERNINEDRMNTTRFAIFSRLENPKLPEKNPGTFLILFTVKDEVGGLAKAVNLISAYNFNMRVLRSRPMHDLPWHYYFYAEVEGSDRSESGKQMLNALTSVCPILKVVGRYTTAE